MASPAASAARETWGTRIGFVLAAMGMAVGFGNVVRFPSMAAQSGGAAFVLVYLLFVFLVGLPLLVAEVVVGREGRKDPYSSFRALGGKGWGWAGGFIVAVSVFFLGYYVVLNGYVARYLLWSIVGPPTEDAAAAFAMVEQGPATLLATLAVVAVAVGVVFLGVRRGLERTALVLMPALLVILAALAVYGLAQPGAGAGVRAYLQPDLSQLTVPVLVAGMGQAFFSLGVGLGAMIVYGSYVGRRSDVPGDAAAIAGGDTLVALAAGFMVFPLLFALGLQADVTGEDVSAFSVLFVTLPTAFAQIGGTTGTVLEVAFFLALLFAAFTSTIAVLEVAVAFLMDRFGLGRRRATLLAAEAVVLLAILPALHAPSLAFMDAVGASVALPLAVLLTALFVGWRLKGASEAVDRGSRIRAGKLLVWWLRTAIPLVVGGVLAVGLVQWLFG